MTFTAKQLARARTMVLALFLGACFLFFCWLWLSSGGKLPLVSQDQYDVDISMADADNLSINSDVRTAGVRVGYISGLTTEGNAVVVNLVMDDPLHDGVKFQLRPKTMLEETFVEVTDGTGEQIPEGTMLPIEVLVPSVQADDVLNAMDPETRAAFGDIVQSLGPATDGTRDDVASLVAGLGDLGRGGADALDILAAQGEDLRALVRETTVMLDVLDSGNGQIADLVTAAHQLNDVTATQEDDLASTFEGLPVLVEAARDASPAVTQLSNSLAPLAASLRASADDLAGVLDELAATTPVLRGMLPELDTDLQLAPDTLSRIPGFTTPTQSLLSPVDIALADLNPMLAYMEPYGPDIGAFYANFSNAVGFTNPATREGAYARFLVLYNEQTVANNPVPLYTVTGSNPYPLPGTMDDPQGAGGAYSGTYTRVEEED